MVSGGITINLCLLHDKYKPHSSNQCVYVLWENNKQEKKYVQFISNPNKSFQFR